MPDRPVVIERTQLGVETTSGTAVAANKRLHSFGLKLDDAADFDRFGPMGQLLDTIAVVRREWSTFAVEGYPDYQNVVYPLSGVIGAATITTPGGGTNSRLWTFTLSSDGTNTPKTFTVQNGDGTTAEQAAYGLFNSFGLSLARSSEQKISGDGFAQRLDYAATLTASPTEIPAIPILATHLDVFADDTSGGIGTTKLTRDFAADFSIGDRYNPLWTINSAVTSFASHIIQKPAIALKLTLGNDAAARALVTTMRAGATKFIRLQALGDIIEGSIPYRLRVDTACKVVAAPSRGDVEGAATLEWEFAVIHDATWGKGLEITVQNSLTAL